MASKTTDERIAERFGELLPPPRLGSSTTGLIGDRATARQWATEASNLIGIATGRRGVHWEAAERILAGLDKRLDVQGIAELGGVLTATSEDRKRGLLGAIEYRIYAETFDDFLDQAERMHKSGSIEGSSVLMAAVLEDTMKKIAAKNGLQGSPGLDETISSLAAAGVFSPVTAKRVRAWAGVRTSAVHARWSELDLGAIGESIRGVRELITNYLEGPTVA
ncbi:MAG TPA: hypothetical protein VH063_06540 [Gaiellaceae bacterium]|nr:hypothetical protein [Gaiellaceae bacterium]